MRKGEPPVIYGDGSQTRDFIYVSDVVNAFILAMEKDFECEMFNCCCGNSAAATTQNKNPGLFYRLHHSRLTSFEIRNTLTFNFFSGYFALT